MFKYQGVSALTRKEAIRDNNSALKQPHLFCKYSSDFHNFSLSYFNGKSINRDHPPLNKSMKPLPLERFND